MVISSSRPVIVFILNYLIALQDCDFRMIMDLVKHAPRVQYLTNLSPGCLLCPLPQPQSHLDFPPFHTQDQNPRCFCSLLQTEG